MVIRMFVDNIILSVLLLACLGLCTAEDDGYDYSRPSIGFSDGQNSLGSQSIYTKPTVYVVASSTPQPAAVYNVKPQGSTNQGFGQYQSVQQYKAPIVTKPASSLPQFGQYQNTQKYQSSIVSTTAKPQAYFGANQGFGQSSSATGNGQYASGQYKAPVISVTSKPQSNIAAYQGFGQPSSIIGTGISGQYKGQSLSVTPKPQTNFGVYQGFGQSSSGSGFGQYASGQYKPPVISVTSKPQTNFGAFQGFGQPTKKFSFPSSSSQPSVTIVAKPKPTYTGSNSKPKPQIFVIDLPNVKPKPTAKPEVIEYYPIKPVQATVVQATAVQATPVQATFVKPIVITAKPQSKPSTQFGQQSLKPSVFTAQIIKPQTSFSSFQGFGQKLKPRPFKSDQTGQYQNVQYQKPSTGYSQTTSTFSQYQKPIVTPKPLTTFQGSSISKPVTSFGNAGPSYLPPSKPQVSSTIEINPSVKPAVSQYNFQGASSTVTPSVLAPISTLTTTKPVVVTAKPQTIFNQFQGSFGKPTYNTQTSFSGFQGSKPFVQYQQPLVSSPIKSQSAFGSFQGFGQTSYQKPAVSQSYYKPSTTIKPQLSQVNTYTSTPTILKPVVVTPKPQSAFSGFGQSVYQKPAVSSFNNFGQQSTTQYTSTPTTIKPLIVTAKPQTDFSGFAQSVYQKPAISSSNNYGQQSFKPFTVTAKPQAAFSGFGQSVYQKPAISTFNSFGQQSSTRYTSTPTTVKPFTVSGKPQAAFSSFGQSVYQKPAISTFNSFGQQSSTNYISTPTTVKPFTVTAKPQTAFSSFGQSVYQKPAINNFNSFGQQSSTRYTSTPTTVKPFTVSGKPQAAFSSFGQSVYQKPAISTFNNFGQKSSTNYISTPTTVKPFTVTAKPQTAFSSFGQSVYQKPAINNFNSFGQQSSTRYASTPTSVKPFTVAAKPQTAFSGLGQSIYQKPAVSSFNNYGQQSFKPFTVTSKPQTAFSGFGQSVYQKPAVSTLNNPTRYTSTPTTVKPFTVTAEPQTVSGFEQSAYQKPAIVPVTLRPQGSSVSTTLAPNPTYTYLPPKGVNAPLTAVSASGAISESFFEFPSATVNQVVDVAQEQKVGGFVSDLKSELPTITNHVSNGNAQEQQVEGIDLMSNKLTATNNKGQEQEYNVVAPSQRRRRDTYSNGAFQGDYRAQTGYLSYQGNPITTQQFGGVQPNSYQGIPYQQIAQAQSSVGITNGASIRQEGFQLEQGSTSNGAQNQDLYNFEGQYGYISSVEDQQQQIPQHYETAASNTDPVKTQAASDSPVQAPRPLNTEEQQIRQVEEKSDNNFQNLQPGSYIGPHVNKNSDHEYNVFDYDQYSKDPEDADV